MSRPYTVFVAVDAEGITGYVKWPKALPEEEWVRERMTEEVNAAIEGAAEAGAREFIVSDIHWDKQNIIPAKLFNGALLVRGGGRRYLWMDYVERTDLVFLIGFHAGCTAAGAVLPHTLDPRITSLQINGREAGEAFISAVTAGRFGVPVGLAAGDTALTKEVLGYLPDIEVVAVKEGISCWSALHRHPKTVLEELRRAGRRAAERGIRGEFKPLYIEEPVKLTVSFSQPGYAWALSLVPGVERTGHNTVSYTGSWFSILNLLALFVNWFVRMPQLEA